MNYVFNSNYINNNELLFYIYVLTMLIIMILTIVFVKKELKNEDK